jgi:hypothetical protein
MRRTVITGKSYRHSWQQNQGNPALAFAFTSLPLDTVHAHLCSANPLMDRVLRRLGIKSDTGTLQTESRRQSEEVLWLSMSKGTWTASLQDPAAH